MLPTPVDREAEGSIRVYVTFCDSKGIGRPGFIDLDRRTFAVLRVSGEPLLDIGESGTFDENGVLPTSVVTIDDRHSLMYYVGYELGTKIRYRMLTGLAISEDGGETFRRHSTVPILERSPSELFFRCGPFVRKTHDGFDMWYIAGNSWVNVGGKPLPEYRIKHLGSTDGLTWAAEGEVAIDITEADEHGFGRPWVVPTESGLRMFYSVRRRSFAAYRLGYADSYDGKTWHRKDSDLGLDVGPDAYDSQAIMYAAPLDIDGRTYCFYNGNDFGRDGFAIAVREDH